MLDGMGIQTGIDRRLLMEAVALIAHKIGVKNASKMWALHEQGLC